MKAFWFIMAWWFGSAIIGLLINISNAQWMHWIIVLLVLVWGSILLWLYNRTK